MASSKVGKQVQAKEICTGSSSSSTSYGSPRRASVTSVEVNAAKAVRMAGLFLEINFLHGWYGRARKDMEQPERGLFAGLWGPLAPRVWPGSAT